MRCIIGENCILKPNVGKNDKMIRIIIGILVIGMGIFYNSWLAIIGIIPLATAFTGFCPLYAFLGLSTEKPHKPAGK